MWLEDSTTIPSEPDVCIVGAGPAGLSTALVLGEAGRSVLVLESGAPSLQSGPQELNDGDHEGEPYVGLARSRHRQVAGTVNMWNVPVHGENGAKYVPLSERDLAIWPIDWDELEPWYFEAQALCGLGPFEYGADFWATSDRRPFDLTGTALTSGVYQFGPKTRFTEELPRRLHELGGVTLQPATTVVGLTTDGVTPGPTSVNAVGADGESFVIRSRAVVLACGAVENARLLLLAGFGSESPWLGRGFMEHARDFSLSMSPDSPDLVTSASFYDLHESEDGHLIGGRLALSDEALGGLQLPNASMTLFPRPRIDGSLLGRVRRRIGGRRGAPPSRYGWSGTAEDGSTSKDFKVILNAEQRPHRANRIVLSDRTDRFGNRLPRLVLNWSPEEQAQFDRLREVVAESLRSARLGRLQYVQGRHPDLSAHHHAGTTRMAVSPEDGVVDRDGRLFQSENFFVAGASVFPTAGFANPTLTIVAMAIRLARHIDQSLPLP